MNRRHRRDVIQFRAGNRIFSLRNLICLLNTSRIFERWMGRLILRLLCPPGSVGVGVLKISARA